MTVAPACISAYGSAQNSRSSALVVCHLFVLELLAVEKPAHGAGCRPSRSTPAGQCRRFEPQRLAIEVGS